MNGLKRTIALCTVLSLSCSLCFSSGMLGDKKRSTGETTPEAPDSPSVTAKRSLTESIETSKSSLQKLKASDEDKAALADIMAQLEAIQADAKAQGEDNVLKAQEIEKLQKQNESLKADVKAAKAGTRAYTRLDGEVRFNDGSAVYGMGGTIGVETRHGIMIEAGTMYDFAGAKRGGLDDLTFHAGVGYKF